MRTVFLITASMDKPYHRLRYRGQEKTWIKDFPIFSNFEYFYLVGNGNGEAKFQNREDLHTTNLKRIIPIQSKILKSEKNQLTFDSSPGWESILSNLLGAMNWLNDRPQNFDFLIRTNVSSYWNLKSTNQLLKNLPTQNLYAGHVVEALDTEFVAGDGVIFSKDVVQKICSNYKSIDAGVIDDVGIGRLLKELQVPTRHISRKWIHTRFDLNDPNLLIGNTHMFRCKFERKFLGKIWRRDVSFMKSLHTKFRYH